jgi:DNA-directed RNA polymerase subunit beta'
VHLYDHFPLNDPKGMMHSSPRVKVGDTVKAGQLLADNNYTVNGHLALGTNLRVGYMPYKGYNFEDGIVISESAAKKLTSEHLHRKSVEIDPDSDLVSKSQYLTHMSLTSKSMPKEHIDALDDDGIIKPGTKVKPGQILVAALRKNNTVRMTEYGKRSWKPWKNNALTWDEDHVGEVVKVVKGQTGKDVKVYIRTAEPMVIGDKLTGRHGNKGIITQILPDHEMPFTKDESGEKRHLEVILNPSGVPTRMNVGQMLETAAAKIAEKTGKHYIVDNFSGPNHDYRAQVLAELKKHGLHDEELVYDPDDARKPLGSVTVGPQYMLKLHHQVEKKLSVRGGGTDLNGRPLPIDSDMQPSSGGQQTGQGLGQLDMYVLLGHNARNQLRESATYRSDFQSQGFWDMIQMGREPPTPKAPFAYEKFISLLKGMGVNVEKHGTNLRLQPMTDREIVEMAGGHKGEIKNAHLTLRSKDLREEKHGLFDIGVTGGRTGTKWGFIKLHEPLPNPIFVGSGNQTGPIPTLLDLRLNDIDKIMRGEQQIDGKTGGAAIEAALKKIDVDHEIQSLKSRLTVVKRGTELNKIIKKLKYLNALKETGHEPHEAYILHNLPVIPPIFRPVTETDKGDLHYSSLNGLYKNLAIVNQKLGEFDSTVFTDDHKHPLRYALYDGLRALQSIGGSVGYDTDSPNGRRSLKGILAIIGGGEKDGGEKEQPKEAYFQSRLVKRRQNLSIRSTIIPEPKLGIDEVGLPRGAAMELYKPFVVADLVGRGLPPLEAQEEMKKDTKVAHEALERVVKDRPLLLKRDPALHKFSILAFTPKLINGKAIQIHPLVTGGFNADFDGDTMSGYVPMSRESVQEAKGMFPSKNLFSPTTGGVMYMPSQESLIGLHLMTQWGQKSGKSFDSVAELKKAHEDHKIGLTDVVKVKGAKGDTTLGRLLIAQAMPSGFKLNTDILHNPEYEIEKKKLRALVTELAKEHSRDFAGTIDRLKDLGNHHSFKAGFSFGLKDLAPLAQRDKIVAEAKVEADRATKAGNHDEAIDVWTRATKKMEQAAEDEYKKDKSKNRLFQMVFSGARGKAEQVRQMVGAPLLMQDGMGRVLPTPVTRSYSEGLDIGDYWQAQHGARKGTLQRALGTSEPGVVSKDIINATMSTLIVSPDCKTNQGILMELKHKDIHDRYLAAPYKLTDGKMIRAGELITPEVMARLKNAGHDKVLVRSPLKCQHGDGLCAKCFGLNESGKLHEVGTNIGVLAGQALSEPAVQMAMDAFHTGGLAVGRGAKSVDRFARLDQLLKLPKKLKGAATLARTSGKVTDIKKDATGGYDVIVNGEKHLVLNTAQHPAELLPHVTVGAEVKRGDALSEGPINPRHLLPLTDINRVQKYLTDEMYHGLYEQEDVRKRNVEVVVRALTNLTQVKDPGHSDHMPNDIVPRSVVEEHNRSLPKGHKPIVHEPVLHGIEQVSSGTGSTNWMGLLNYQRLAQTIARGAARAWKTDLHGSHPIPAYAHGSEFGKPPPSKPKHVY